MSGDLSIKLSSSHVAYKDIDIAGGASRTITPTEPIATLPNNAHDDDTSTSDNSTIPFSKSRSQKKKLLLAGIAIAVTVALAVGLGATLGTNNPKRSLDAAGATLTLLLLTVMECMELAREEEL